MSLLDLQALEISGDISVRGKKPPGSRASKGCPIGFPPNPSNLSILICG